MYSVDYAAIVLIDKAAGKYVIPPRSIGGITGLAAYFLDFFRFTDHFVDFTFEAGVRQVKNV
jgi:hypothetical protein